MKKIIIILLALSTVLIQKTIAQDRETDEITKEQVLAYFEANPMDKAEFGQFLKAIAEKRNIDLDALVSGKMELAGTWNFTAIGGQPAPAGTLLKFEENGTGLINIGQGEAPMNYTAEKFVIKMNIGEERIVMEVLEYQKNYLKMKDQNDGTVVELKK
jgi:hypothetical protein